MASEGKICISAGKAAGGIVRKTSGIRKKIGSLCHSFSENVKNICREITGYPRQVKNLCVTVKGKGEIARLEEKEKDIFIKLGTRAWALYNKKFEDPVFEENVIVDLIEELTEYNEEIQKNEEYLSIQKSKMARLAVFKRARANLSSKNPRVRKVAILILKKLGGSEFIPYFNEMLGDPDPNVRQKAAEVMHELIETSESGEAGPKLSLIRMNKMMDEASDVSGKNRKEKNNEI